MTDVEQEKSSTGMKFQIEPLQIGSFGQNVTTLATAGGDAFLLCKLAPKGPLFERLSFSGNFRMMRDCPS